MSRSPHPKVSKKIDVNTQREKILDGEEPDDGYDDDEDDEGQDVPPLPPQPKSKPAKHATRPRGEDEYYEEEGDDDDSDDTPPPPPPRSSKKKRRRHHSNHLVDREDYEPDSDDHDGEGEYDDGEVRPRLRRGVRSGRIKTASGRGIELPYAPEDHSNRHVSRKAVSFTVSGAQKKRKFDSPSGAPLQVALCFSPANSFAADREKCKFHDPTKKLGISPRMLMHCGERKTTMYVESYLSGNVDQGHFEDLPTLTDKLRQMKRETELEIDLGDCSTRA